MRDPKEGVALAAIVAKETTNGQWSGLGGGLGIGTSGPGLFVGGMAGTKSEQSKRAAEFDAPEKPKFRLSSVYGPVILFAAIVGAVALYRSGLFAPGVFEEPAPTTAKPDFITTARTGLSSVANALFIVMIPALVALFWWCSGPRMKEQEKEHASELERAKVAEVIYYRLRYVENDHIVFDPKTGDEVPASREFILKMIEKITDAEMPKIEK
ncbi:hypothetical protein WAQ86_004768 [Salmonella enterica]